ncbi:hypothetical protein OROGR_025431 [Orobanche gracilis]
MFSPTRALCLLIFLYIVASECKAEGYDQPLQCAHVECPPYSVIHSEEEFEIRSYMDVLWVSGPKISESSYLNGFGKGFLMLDDYYRGNNMQNMTINQTLPIMVDADDGPDYIHNMTYTVYRYVPHEYQNSMPTPISHEIKPVKLPAHKYAAVRRFVDEDRDELIPQQVDALRKSLHGTPYQRAATSNMFTILFYELFEEEDGVDVREILLSYD